MHKEEWLTVSKVREYLEEMGFGFSHYRANSAGIHRHHTLKRMVPTNLESMNSGSGTLQAPKDKIGDRIAEGYKSTLPAPPGSPAPLPNADDIARDKSRTDRPNKVAMIEMTLGVQSALKENCNGHQTATTEQISEGHSWALTWNAPLGV